MSRNLMELIRKHSPHTKLSAKTNRRREAGSSLLEFGLAFPVLMLILPGAADFGRIFYTYVTLSSAAQTGAEYGATSMSSLVAGWVLLLPWIIAYRVASRAAWDTRL
jgi:hypothetical protein